MSNLENGAARMVLRKWSRLRAVRPLAVCLLAVRPLAVCLLAGYLLLVFASCPPETSIKRKIDEPCERDEDCLSERCLAGSCTSNEPKDLLQTCSGHGECKSLNCIDHLCVQGNKSQGSLCRFDEECEENIRCLNQRCGGAAPMDRAIAPADFRLGSVDRALKSE